MYVKFISKPNEWFDAGTEVFDATICNWGKTRQRLSVEKYNSIWLKAGHIIGLGLRKGFWDEELCPLEEFDIIETETQL
jgi:hypothetical protein